MKALVMVSMFVGSLAFGYQNDCTIGRDGSLKTLIIDGRSVEYFDTLEEAANGFAMVKNAGLCSNKKSNCTIGRVDGLKTVVVNDSVVEYFSDLASAVAGFNSLKNSGVCN